MSRTWGPLAAWGLFTILPAPVVEEITPDIARRALHAMPLVGLGLGVMAGAAATLVTLLNGGQPLVMIAGLAVLAMSTGCLHLDGLADTADGLGSRKPAEQALEIMRQSDIGPMGVTAIILVLALEIAAAASPHLGGWHGVWALVTLPMVARVAPLAASGRWVPSARKEGFGALFTGLTSPFTLAVVMAAVLVVSVVSGLWLFGPHTGIAAAIACLAAWGFEAAWQRHIVMRLHGVTGDVFGSLVEMTGLVYLLVLAVGA